MPKHPKLTRREFLETSGLAAGAVAALPTLRPPLAKDAALASKLPHRTLGRTGQSVSILAFGCGSRFLMYPEEQASAVLNQAIDSGIDYFDTAVSYGDGESERRVGRVMATRRNEVFLATKIPGRSRTCDAALKEVEASLKRLQTDQIDLVHLHSLGDAADLAKIAGLKSDEVARFIGIASHTDGAVMAQAIEHNELDCVQLAMNPARAARFEELALPMANKKNLGVILMKVTGQDRLMLDGGADAASLLQYAWSLPVSTVVCGMPKLEFLQANVASARAYAAPLPASEMERLRQQLAGRKVVLERFFAHHHDGLC